MFKLEADNTYSIEAGNPWYTFVTTDAIASDYVSLDQSELGAYTVTWTKDMGIAANVEAFTNAALAYAEANGITATQSVTVPVEGTELPANVTKNPDETYSVVFSGLETGYYLLDSVTNTICVLGADTPMVINDKDAVITIDSFTGTEAGTEVGTEVGTEAVITEIGKVINYKIIIKVPAYSSGGEIQVKCDDTLKLNADSIEIKKGDELTSDVSVNKNTSFKGFSLTIPRNNDYTSSTSIKYTVTYSAELMGTAKIYSDKNDSTVSIKMQDGTSVSKTVSTTTYAFGLKSVNSIDNNQLLAGAVFELYRDSGYSEKINLVKTEDGNYRLATSTDTSYDKITTISNESVRVQGLKGNTTYYLRAVTPPTGYQPYGDAPISVLLNSEVPVVTVPYSQSSLLPSTGGVGTAFCYIIGTALMLGAGAVLVIRRRMFFE